MELARRELVSKSYPVKIGHDFFQRVRNVNQTNTRSPNLNEEFERKGTIHNETKVMIGAI